MSMWEPGTDDQAEYGKGERLDLQQGWKSRFHFFFVNCLYPSEKTGKLAWFISNAKEKNI